MKPFPPRSSCLTHKRTTGFTKSLSLAVSQLQTGVTDLLLHTRISNLIPESFIEWLSTHARCFNPLWLGGCAAAPANVHVVYSTAGSGLQHTTVGNHTHAPQHAHAPSGSHCWLHLKAFRSAVHYFVDNQDGRFDFNPPVHSPQM